jgi:hypothetical protein
MSSRGLGRAIAILDTAQDPWTTVPSSRVNQVGRVTDTMPTRSS